MGLYAFLASFSSRGEVVISAHGQSQGLAINLQYTLYHVINIFENEVSSVTAMHPPRNLVRPIQPRAALGGFCYKLQVYFASLLEVNMKFTSRKLQVFFPAIRSECFDPQSMGL